MDLVVESYKRSAGFPRTEQFGLTSQIRRAASSIALNIVEGSGCDSSAEFQRFLGYSLRSAYEVMTAVEIAQRLGYCSSDTTQSLSSEADEIAAMIVSLSRSLD